MAMSALAACLRLTGAAGEGVAAVMRQAPRDERLRWSKNRAPDAGNTDSTTTRSSTQQCDSVRGTRLVMCGRGASGSRPWASSGCRGSAR